MLAVDNLFIVRHGETTANVSDINAGPRDYPLTRNGMKAISYLADELSEIKIGAIYSSPVFRAVQSAKILARPHEIGVKILEGLTEAKLKPELVGKKGRHHILTSPEAYEETYQELEERVIRAVDLIKKRGSRNTIAVSHGDVLVALLQHVVERKIGRNRYYVLNPDPGSLSLVDLKERPKLVLFNYHRKLFDNFESF
jgi:broad specificity phosphatase PhoE